MNWLQSKEEMQRLFSSKNQDFITVTTSSGNINSMGQYALPHPVYPVGDQALIIRAI